MRRTTHRLASSVMVCVAGCIPGWGLHAQPASVKEAVIATERAFAKTMADRDRAQFATFISAEAVFFSGNSALRGKDAIARAWAGYFKGSQAPFSWEPATVEVLESGTLALSSGPVRDPAGKLIGTFTSIWRLEARGHWHIVFDKGNEATGCRDPAAPSAISTGAAAK